MLRLFSGGVPGAHVWRFFRAGGLDQVRLETADDLRHIGELDQKLWVALSCPVRNLEFDNRTLELIDTDKDGRVRVPEVVAAVRWAVALLKDPTDLIRGVDGLPLAAINDASAEGKAVLASARQILRNLGKEDALAVTVADTSDTVKIFAETRFNGDGVIPPAIAGDAAVATVIEEAIALMGPDSDRSGKPGLSKAKADAFFAELEAFAAWWQAGEDASSAGSGVLPMGEATPAAYAAFAAVKAKITDYFQRCRLAAFDGRATAALNRTEADFTALAPKDLSAAGDDIAALPLSRIEPSRSLDLAAGLNPMWQARMATFRALVVEPLLGAGTATLSDAAWQDIATRLAPYESWVLAKKGASAEKLGINRIRAILASEAKTRIAELITQDLGVASEVSSIDNVDRLARYHRDLYALLRNYVNFADFYDPRKEAVFQAGTLFLDQRSCDLCIRVDDPGAHSALGNLGKVYLAYCACTRAGGEKMTIAAAFTQGDADFLMNGRNGVFYDRKGRDWDATIVKVLEHPISIRQAFWMPYKKIGKMIHDVIERIMGSADKAMMDKAEAGIASQATAVQAGKKPDKPSIDTGMLAAIGIAATSMFSGLSGVIATVMGLPLWKVPFIMVGVILAISGPAMIIAFLKLRQRTLGPILEANGWAINGRVTINIPLGSAFTTLKALPANAVRSLEDPFEDKEAKRRFWRLVTWIVSITVILLVVLALTVGRIAYAQGWFDTIGFQIRDTFGLVSDEERIARKAASEIKEEQERSQIQKEKSRQKNATHTEGSSGADASVPATSEPGNVMAPASTVPAK